MRVTCMENPTGSPPKLMQIVPYCFRRVSLISLLFAATVLGQPGSSTLEVGKPAEFTLKGTETHNYILPLRAGQYVDLSVDQRGINVSVALFTPDGAAAY